MNIAVCDDQAEELETVTELLRQWQAQRRCPLHFRTFRCAAQLLDAARREFDEAAALVFLTSSPGFAYESYGVKAMEYLLKPVRAQTLHPILDQLWQREQRPQDSLTLKTGGTLIRIPFSQLAFVEVNGKHLYFNLAGGQVRQTAGTLRDYEAVLLAREEFTRIHRSYIVNMMQISELSPAGVRTFSGKNLPVSRLLYPQLQKNYMKLLFLEREG